MHSATSKQRWLTLLTLHAVFALTGIADAGTGPVLPAIAREFHLSDSQSGNLLFWIFAGMATGALLARGNYARTMTAGLIGMAIGCFCFPWVSGGLLNPSVFVLGIFISLPMTSVSLFAGRNFPQQRASTLTALNFTWSAGAMAAPLLVARLLATATWHAVYFWLSAGAALAAIAVAFTLRDGPEAVRETQETAGNANLRLVGLYAAFFFLQVGVESAVGGWISTYLVRTLSVTASAAAAATALYWGGFLASRAISSVILIRVRAERLLRLVLPAALSIAVVLVIVRSGTLLEAAIFGLGAALGPVFPTALASFFDRARHSSDSRYVLALSGFGGSVLPWLAGMISQTAGNLRAGLGCIPAALAVMVVILPWMLATYWSSMSNSQSKSRA